MFKKKVPVTLLGFWNTNQKTLLLKKTKNSYIVNIVAMHCIALHCIAMWQYSWIFYSCPFSLYNKYKWYIDIIMNPDGEYINQHSSSAHADMQEDAQFAKNAQVLSNSGNL